ncbi:MAG: diacylglycerol kinase family protein [Myxococcales bacterium]|nr:hypothetical protein [Myxococcota bacterium]MDW8283620.1 diacylglycerol kinase family protein [Myxococcales bacterium]
MATAKTKDVALLCNPQAGGRWRALADVLDSQEAIVVRRIVTDEIDDISGAIADLGHSVRLLCIYGGDGTIYRVLAELLATAGPLPTLALLGGGTMNVTARWCGMRGPPGDNFRAVMRAYLSDRLLSREVSVVAVRQSEREHFGFTFGVGPLVRLLERYENGQKGRLAAVRLGLKAIAAAVTSFPRSYRPLLREMEARIVVDGQQLPYSRYTAVFANVTGAINPLIEPFLHQRSRDTFHFLAYATSTREFAMLTPLLARAKVPIDPKALLRPASAWKQMGLSLLGKGALPLDPRYVNHPARHVTIYTDERHFTIDGELLPLSGPLEVRLGPTLRLAVIEEP